jgi:hypothetical protein
MAAINLAATVLKNSKFTIAGNEYQGSVSSVKLDPSTSAIVWQGLVPNAVITDVTNPTWAATIAFAQDLNTANSLSLYLLNNVGKQVTVTYAPENAVGKVLVTFTAIITPGGIGGDVNTVATSTVTLGVVGTPTFSAVTA